MIGSRMRWPTRWIAVVFAMALPFTFVGCSPTSTPDEYADYGTYGSEFAQSFVSTVPYRKAFTPGERKAGDFIAAALVKLGYSPKVSEFDENGIAVVSGGATASSRNIVVTIPGSGFQVAESDGTNSTVRKSVILCTHYDNAFSAADAQAYPDYDGIQGNGSGVATLMQVANTLRVKPVGFDVILAFYGAGYTDPIGASYDLSGMSTADLARIEAVYCVDSIYAGDKLYADAGWNSTEPGNKYAMRKKLYEMTDIAIKYRLDLRTNQAGFDYDLLGTGQPVMMREISTNRSDYSPFDAKGLPCVFFESCDFFAQSVPEMVESKNPFFSDSNGKIRGTPFDSYTALNVLFEENRLQNRINEVAFLLVKMIERGMDGGTSVITPPIASVTPQVNSSTTPSAS
jgi:alkaline phosphatase isozyme conversion protein